MRNRLIAELRSALARTGRAYRIDLEALPDESLREFIRLLRDLDYDRMSAVRRARTMPWRMS